MIFFTINTNYTRKWNLKIYKEFACSMRRRNFLPIRITSTLNALLQKQSLPQILLILLITTILLVSVQKGYSRIMSTEYDEEEMGESGPVTTQEKGGLQNIMSEKHLVCKGPSAVVGIHFLFFANSTVSQHRVRDQLLST